MTQTPPLTILMIRHGEKPISGDDLSPRGWDRARALPSLFSHRFARPVGLFAQGPDAGARSNRAVETLQFLGQDFGLAVNPYGRDEYQNMVQEVMTNSAYDGKFVVVCWQHAVLSNIAQAFGVNSVPNYPKNAFDRAWLITFDRSGGQPTFNDLPQQLLPGDSSQ